MARTGGEALDLALGLCRPRCRRAELGHLEAARGVLLDALAVANDVGDVHLETATLCNLAHVERRLAETDAAHEHFRRALAALDGHSLPEVVIWSLDGLASTERDPARGAVLLGAAEGLMASTSYNHPQTRAQLEATRASLEQSLGEERATALRAEGAAASSTSPSRSRSVPASRARGGRPRRARGRALRGSPADARATGCPGWGGSPAHGAGATRERSAARSRRAARDLGERAPLTLRSGKSGTNTSPSRAQ